MESGFMVSLADYGPGPRWLVPRRKVHAAATRRHKHHILAAGLPTNLRQYCAYLSGVLDVMAVL